MNTAKEKKNTEQQKFYHQGEVDYHQYIEIERVRVNEDFEFI